MLPLAIPETTALTAAVAGRVRMNSVYLVYIDDSGSDKPSPIVVVGAVVIPDTEFWRLDLQLGVTVEALTPPDKFEKFEEFHSAELFGGFGLFHGVDESTRHRLIQMGLRSLKRFGLPFIYAAVDRRLLQASAFGSSDPVDVAFRLCLCSAEDWIRDATLRKLPGDATQAEKVKAVTSCPYLVIMDDSDDRALKHTLRQSFRSLRPLSHRPGAETARLSLSHDDMYFGDSKSSIGIQIADLCAHVMLRRFRDGIEDEFFDLVAPYAISARPEPYWEQCRSFMKVHEPEPARPLLGTIDGLLQIPPEPSPVEGQGNREDEK